MSFPDDPCEVCPRVTRGLPMPCQAMSTRTPKLCQHVMDGHDGYIRILCEETGTRVPPVQTQVKNFLGSMGTVMLEGVKMASREEQERRLSICHQCPSFQGGRCVECGCFMALKVRLTSLHCPLPEPKW